MHQHQSMPELQRQIRESIAMQGFAIRHVLSTGDEPEFTYTVGLHKPDSSLPELFMSGLSRETRVHWMLHLGFLIQGPPPLEGRQRIAQESGVSVEAQVYPPGGRVFQPGVRYGDLASNGLPTCFGEVEQQYYAAYFGQAIAFHETLTFPVLQVVRPDTWGRFFFDSQFERRFQDRQRILFDAQRYLPLRESEKA